MEQLQQTNETLIMQVWILGGVIIFLLGMLTFFARNAYQDIKMMLGDHENRLRVVEDNKIEMNGLVERHEKDIQDHRSLMRQLENNINRLSKI